MQCGYCYTRGHNKMGCPTAKGQANDKQYGDGTLSPMGQYDEYVKSHPDTYVSPYTLQSRNAVDWDWKIVQAVEIQLEKRKRSRTKKVCNFCGDTGHNKRTCFALKDMKKKLTLANANFREAVAQSIIDTGQGVGAVISGEHEHYDQSKQTWVKTQGIALVQSIKWDGVNLWDVNINDHGHLEMHPNIREHIFQLRWSSGQTECMTLIADRSELFGRNWQRSRTIISPSTRVVPPDEWFTCEDEKTQMLIKNTFKGRKSPNADSFSRNWSELITKWAEVANKK